MKPDVTEGHTVWFYQSSSHIGFVWTTIMNHGLALLDITKLTMIMQLLLGVCLEKESLGGVAKISLYPIHPVVILLHIILSHLRLQTEERHGDRITCHLVSKVSLCPSGVHVSAACPRREVGVIMAEQCSPLRARISLARLTTGPTYS